MYCHTMVVMSGVSSQLAAHSPLNYLCTVESYVLEIHQDCRRIGKFGRQMGLIGFRFWRMEEGIGAGCLQVVSHFLLCLWFSIYVLSSDWWQLKPKPVLLKNKGGIDAFYVTHLMD